MPKHRKPLDRDNEWSRLNEALGTAIGRHGRTQKTPYLVRPTTLAFQKSISKTTESRRWPDRPALASRVEEAPDLPIGRADPQALSWRR